MPVNEPPAAAAAVGEPAVVVNNAGFVLGYPAADACKLADAEMLSQYSLKRGPRRVAAGAGGRDRVAHRRAVHPARLARRSFPAGADGRAGQTESRA
jgi:hypothetical protein